MSMQVAAASSLPQEVLVARTARSKKHVEESFGERLSQRMMTYYEREEGRPPAHLLGQMAEALGVSVEELLGIKPVDGLLASQKLNSRGTRR